MTKRLDSGRGTWIALAIVAALAACDGNDDDTPDGGGDTSMTTNGTPGGEDTSDTGTGDTISFADDIRPIFQLRCTLCHHPNAPVDINIADPFDPDNGLVGSINSWAVAHPEGNTPMLNVSPGNPDESFLLDKVSNRDLEPAVAGGFMPAEIERVTEDELADLRTWIEDGANDDAFYASNIRPIFGDETRLGGGAGKCSHCHYASSPIPPNLTDPFDPDDGVVGVASVISPGMMRVAPGDPDASLLIAKIEATEPGAIGSPMPMRFQPLTAGEVERLRTWIAEGAQNN